MTRRVAGPWAVIAMSSTVFLLLDAIPSSRQ
jgi:hypothetical protein